MPQFLTLNQIRIAADTCGSPQNPLLVLVHGLMGNRTGMMPLAQALSDTFFVVSYDCRGHGQSDKPAAFTLDDHAADLLAVIGHFGGRACVFGYSMGSYIAAQAAIRQPEEFARLVLAVTKPRDDGSGSSVARLLKAHGLSPDTATGAQTAAMLESALWHVDTPQAYRRACTHAAAARAKAARIPVLTAAQRAAISRALVGFDLRAGLHRVSCPTLVLAGIADGINAPEQGRVVADALPDAQFVVFEHSGHMLREEEPVRLQKLLRTFFQAA